MNDCKWIIARFANDTDRQYLTGIYSDGTPAWSENRRNAKEWDTLADAIGFKKGLKASGDVHVIGV